MFTGIIECTGKILSLEKKGTNLECWISSPISGELGIDQSVSHNGVCLTVDQLGENSHRVTAIEETLRKTALSEWVVGMEVNLERCLPMNGRLDGHLVQGHVDTTAVCTHKQQREGSWEYRFTFPPSFAQLVIEKGSISVNGTSLTCFNIGRDHFTIAIIPYTYTHTNIHQVEPGTKVNIEFDMIGKYVQRRADLS
ncbi:MAG: riboflavin synthase [Bacteroidota bacterium]|nr:riboflavin synthase [Bacteroidota bacterium]